MITTWTTLSNWKNTKKKEKRRNIVPNPFKYVWEFSFLPTYTYPHGKHWKKGKYVPWHLSY